MRPQTQIHAIDRIVGTLPRQLASRRKSFLRDEDGSLIIFSLMIFVLMLTISGLAVDIMRFETTRTKLQNTVDSAALAAASLSQRLEPVDVVNDFFAKSGMSDFLSSVQVLEGFSRRKVEINTNVSVPTHFFNMVGVDVLSSPANAIAQEAIGNVEIALVLDVSGSMRNYNRLTNLKVASRDFIDTVFAASQDGTVSTSIVPYSEQVNAGPDLLQHFNRGLSAHSYSYCLNFSSSDYQTTGISPTTEMEQTLPIDPWSTESLASTSWNIGHALPNSTCEPASSREILPWSQNPTALKAKVDSFSAKGNTSIDVGLKWGAALLDPGLQPVLNNMVVDGDVDAALAGRPLAWDDRDAMKIMVVMTDGDNTAQHYMQAPYRIGDTAVYKYVEGGTTYLSIWTGEGQPVNDPEPACVRYSSETGNCREWDTTEQTNNDWYRVNDNAWWGSAYGGGASVRLTWADLWALVPVEYFADEILYRMGATSTERTAIKNAEKYHNTATKNARMTDICAAAKAKGITIFAVGLEISTSSADLMRNCASSPAHFFNVDNLDIGYAFQAIASQINQLRLIQ